MNASTSSLYSPYSPFSPSSLSPGHNIDRDVLAQRALLGEDAYNSELESPSPLATPSPMIKQLSPLTVASHLQDNMLFNPFLDDYDAQAQAQAAARQPYSAVAPHHHSVKPDAIQKGSSRRSPPSSSSSAMTSGLGLDLTEERDRVSSHSNGHTRTSRQQQSSVNLDQPAAPATLLLPIQEDNSRSSPPTSRRRTNKPAILNSYSLPPSTEMSSPSSTSSATWRRPSPFPLGPVPPPLPPRRARYEPPPHIVDVAVERFNINTRTISSPTTTSSLSTSTSAPSSALEQERQRQWQQWEAERVRSLEMTREAAKNNRVQAPSSSSSNRTTATTTTAVSEIKASTSSQSTKKSKSKWWWCFGGGAVETDSEQVINEKRYTNDRRRQSVASLDAIDVEEDADDEEWNEARVATGLLSSFNFSCSKSNNTRPRATLKKKTY